MASRNVEGMLPMCSRLRQRGWRRSGGGREGL